MTRAALVISAVIAAVAFAALSARAETPVAARTLRAHSVIGPGDLAISAADVPGALKDPALIVGLETRVALYAGRPIMPGDVGPPALVERNQIVRLAYDAGGLSIVTEGRALDRAGAGDPLRVMNLASRTTVTGFVLADGTVAVGALPGS
jgi:flagella basal body P-ring formation protein FlgA